MKLHTISILDIVIPSTRQRRTFSAEDVTKLASSISQTGLIHPVVVRQDGDNIVLVAGERRLRAMNYVWEFGQEVRCGEFTFPEGSVPCLYQGEMDPIDAFEMELEENIRRVDLPWQERAEATARLLNLRTVQSERDGRDAPTMEEIAAEVHGTSTDAREMTRQEILVSRHLDDPDVAKSKSVGDAFKLLKRKDEARRYADLAKSVGATFASADHTLIHGDCFEHMAELPDASFDVILTDPPYGIDADQFSDSGGRVPGAHFYDDSWQTWNTLAARLGREGFRLGKAQSHAYIFCDVDNFVLFKHHMQEAGWRVFRTPLVWVNPTAMRAPWPEHGPQRKYQICLFAIKGDRHVNQLHSDVITCASDENLGHQAQKPVALYSDLLRRSIRPGDSVLDPFGGTGPVIPAAHELKCKATFIEQDETAYGIAVRRRS